MHATYVISTIKDTSAYTYRIHGKILIIQSISSSHKSDYCLKMGTIVLLLIPLLAVQSVVGIKFHIVTSLRSDCPGELAGEPCLTLQQYVSYPSRNSNVTLEFERGNHSLKSSFTISGGTYFGLTAATNATINCDGLTSTYSVRFSGTTNVDINGVSFIRCGRVEFRSVTNVTVTTSNFQMSVGTQALYLYYSSYIYIINSNFSDNHGALINVGYGSAIYSDQASSLTIIQTNFSNNTAYRGGGAIYFRARSSTSTFLSIEGCSFLNNRAAYDNGGAVYVTNNYGYRSTVIISNRNIFDNSSAYYDGGAFYITYASTVTVTGNKFINNRAMNSNGGIFYVSSSDSVDSNGNTLMDNTARLDGGAFYLSSVSRTVNTGNEFVNNTAGDDGGAVYVSSGSTTNSGNHFFNNRATDDGGALYISGSSTNNDNTFINNTANNGAGGAIYVSGPISDTGSTFSSNRANSNGGALYVSGRYRTVVTEGSTFINNRVRNGGGGAIYAPGYGVSVTISNNHFINNIAYVSGGGLSVLGSQVVLRINGSMFINNLITGPDGNGGAVYVAQPNTQLIIVSNSTFVNNSAINGTGGAIYAKKGFAITNTVFGYNKALSCAAMNIEQSNFIRSMTLMGSTFLHNTAVGSTDQGNIGGAGCIRNADTSVSSCTFSHNVATDGGVFNIEDSTITIETSTFKNNTAGVDGGVFYTRAFPSTYTINESIFINNRAGDDGGVIYLGRNGSLVQLHGSSFTANTAVDRGGAVAMFGSAINITNTNMQNNMARSGDDISTCNSINMNNIILINLNERIDPQYAVCTLYDGSVQYFPEPFPHDDSNLDISVYFQAFISVQDDRVVPVVMAVTDAASTTTGQEVDPILKEIQSQLLGTSVVVYLLFSFFIIFVVAVIVVMVVKYKRKKSMQQQPTVNRMSEAQASPSDQYTESIELYEEPEWCAQGQSNTKPFKPNAGYVNWRDTQHYVK